MSALTHVYKTSASPSLRALAISLIPTLSWRHHGIGLLQGYVQQGDSVEVRLHIWSPDLIKSGMAESGAIHDHRFNLVSHVLIGTIVHEECFPEVSQDGDHGMLKLTHARAAEDTKFHGPTELLSGTFNVRRNSMFINAGHTYSFPARNFHKTIPCSLVVTCVEKHEQQTVSPRVLYPIGTPPIMAFGHDINHILCKRIIGEAINGLRNHRD